MEHKGLRGVLIGCGGFSANYLPVYGELPDCTIVACFDANKQAADRMSSILGGDSASVDRIEEAVDRDFDFAVVSTPNAFHEEHAERVLGAGASLLIQKPLGRTSEEAQAIVRAWRSSKDAGRSPLAGMYMSMLDFDFFWALREAVGSGSIFGSVTEVTMRLGHTGGLNWAKGDGPKPWRFSRDQTGGGAFIMLGVHYLHLARWLFGFEYAAAGAVTRNQHCPHIEGEDIAMATLETTSGPLVSVSTAWNSTGEHLAIYGTRGSLIYRDNSTVRLISDSPCELPGVHYSKPGEWQDFQGVVPPKFADSTNPYNQHRRFVDALRERREPDVPLEEGLKDVLAVEAVYRSAAEKKTIEVGR